MTELSRRQFLVQSAGVAGVGLGLSNRSAADAGPIPRGTLRLGFIGLGDRGRYLLESVLRMESVPATGAIGDDAPRIEINALCDVNPQRLRGALDAVDAVEAGSVRPGPAPSRRLRQRPTPSSSSSRPLSAAGARVRGYTNYRALLDAPDVDAVVIATPVYLHAEQAVTSLYAGKHVYLEKPLAATIGDCRAIRQAALDAAARGVVFQVGLQRRYNPRYRASIDHLASGALGRPLFVRAQWHAAGNSPKDKPWLYRRERSGDIVVEQATHQFDLFNWALGGVPARVSGFGGTHRDQSALPGRDTMDHYGLVLEYPGGAKVSLTHLTYAIPDRRFSGIYEIVFAERGGVDLGAARVWPRDGKARALDAASGSDTPLAIGGFAAAALAQVRPVADIDVGYRANVVALMCRRALETGRPVTWGEVETA